MLAASTGIVGATVITMGLISLPTMLKRGYSPELATGTIASAGTLGQIIPPSVVLVLLGSVLNVSVGDLFTAALIPGTGPGGRVLTVHCRDGRTSDRSRLRRCPPRRSLRFRRGGIAKQVISAFVLPFLLIAGGARFYLRRHCFAD